MKPVCPIAQFVIRFVACVISVVKPKHWFAVLLTNITLHMRIFATLLLLCAAAGYAFAAHGDVLVSSSFHFGQDGWSLFGPGDLTIGDRSGMLFGSDKGKTVWYCRATPHADPM